MCYSSLVDRALRKAAKEFKAQINWAALHDLYRMRSVDGSIKIPDGMEVGLVDSEIGNELERLVDNIAMPIELRYCKNAKILDIKSESLSKPSR